jgi:hypothetical protein
MNIVTLRITCRLGAAAALCGLLTGCADRKPPIAPSVPPRQFATPEEAASALVAASEKYDVPALKAIFGSEGDDIVSSEDTIADRNNAIAFAAEARVHERLEFDSARTTAVLNVGVDDWPMPIPIVEQGGRWHFDAASGREEVLRRRIGGNELNAIQVCHDYVDAQRTYAFTRRDESIVNQYAQRVISTPGKQDGLAWRAADGTWQGPMGETIAQYISEGYSERYEPFHGYYFKILRGQGPAAPLGKMDFMVEGAMLGGFALGAAPADYEVTGIKTFIVSYEGIVYEKDLGETTLEQFKTMERYNPDSTWRAVQDP